MEKLIGGWTKLKAVLLPGLAWGLVAFIFLGGKGVERLIDGWTEFEAAVLLTCFKLALGLVAFGFLDWKGGGPCG